jgi:hypothetical protein
MRFILILACLALSTVPRTAAEVSIKKSSMGWELTNGHILMKLACSSSGVRLESLRREGGVEWAVPDKPIVVSPERANSPYRFADDDILSVAKGAKQLTLRFQSPSGGLLSLMLRIYPTTAVIEMAMRMENRGQSHLQLDTHIDPLFFTVKNPEGTLVPFSSAPGQQGFQPVGSLGPKRDFDNWLVLENQRTGESALIGGEPGLGVLGWKASVDISPAGAELSAGTILTNKNTNGPPPFSAFDLSPGEVVETPITFFALAEGDSDNAGNEAFHYLKRYIFLTPLPNTPQVTYNIWLTERDSEALILKELELAKHVGFDVFYHDATWSKDSSVIPGMNDWTKGLGSYEEDRRKFPDGLAKLSDAVHAAGLMFGLWVDPGNVDAVRVTSGEIPTKWLAMIDGKTLGGTHPSLSPSKQLCLGDPEVVAWIEKQLSDIIEKWHLDWIKWDPSATVSYECTRTDHGHGKTDGAYAAYRGRLEIERYLLKRFPNLSGFEVDPSLSYSRTNPGPKALLPGGYINEFITGPMLGPNVWGSLAGIGVADSVDQFRERWYSASALDYNLRKHFTHGISFGVINGMWSQFLSNAPSGYVEAFERNLLYFKQYRHLLLDDVYHPKLGAAGWSSIQYVTEDSTESVVFVFRDKSDVAVTTVRLRALDSNAKYQVTSLNDRPGRERVMTGQVLMNGIS